MAAIQIKFALDTSAFYDADEILCETAIADVLSEIAERIDSGNIRLGEKASVRDVNGNYIGNVTWEDVT